MARVKRGNHRKEKRKRVLDEAKGFYGMKSTSYRIARQAVERAGVSAYRDRRRKKRDFRSLWIVRINAAARLHGMSYNRLIEGLRRSGNDLNRKMLAELAVHEPAVFAELVQTARGALEQSAST
ncbi:MAG TPA: 50S ribosomal protein L20 [Thermoanaerobaculia bacterium]|nr:50S ribosomal protein L20 [Thermoanaerobaculia bacterium]